MAQREDHSWCAAWREMTPPPQGDTIAPEMEAIAQALCLLCPRFPEPTTKNYATAKHRSKAWEHTAKYHGEYNPKKLGTTSSLV